MCDTSTDTVSAAAEFVALIPVIVGGVIALAGGVVAAIVNHVFTTRRDRVTLRRNKLESLVSAAHDLDIWIKKSDNYHLYGGPEVLEQSPMATILTVVALYWSEISKEASELDNAVDKYVIWLMRGAQSRAAGQSLLDHSEQLPSVWKPFLDARTALLRKAEHLVQL